MNAITIGTATDPTVELPRMEHTQYIGTRVLDALLREDVRACVSTATLVSSTALPERLVKYANVASSWLKVMHFDAGCLWIPVAQASFMQEWRSAGLPLVWQVGEQVTELYAV